MNPSDFSAYLPHEISDDDVLSDRPTQSPLELWLPTRL